jgi:hypothetical protein
MVVWYYFLLGGVLVSIKVAQQSVHPTLGILAQFQAFFYASAFSQSDGVPPPCPSAGNANRWATQMQKVCWLNFKV